LPADEQPGERLQPDAGAGRHLFAVEDPGLVGRGDVKWSAALRGTIEVLL
jgi:hypothetical protein